MVDYDAFVLVSFGGPEGPADVMPFLENVTRGRGVPRERLAEVAHHYDRFGGVSPINQQCRDLLAAIEKDFAGSGLDLPLYWGNRNWDPYLADTVAQMAARRGTPRDRVRDLGLRVLLELPAVPRRHRERAGAGRGRPHRGSTRSGISSTTPASSAPSPSPPGGHRVAAGRRPDWCPAGVHGAQRAGVDGGGQRAGRRPVPGPAGGGGAAGRRGAGRAGAASAMAARLPEPQRAAVGAVAAARTSATISPTWPRAGAPGAVVVIPVGFVSDHLEVLLRPRHRGGADWRARLGLPLARAATPGTHPRFVSMITELVTRADRGQPGARRARLLASRPTPAQTDAAVARRQPAARAGPGASA